MTQIFDDMTDREVKIENTLSYKNIPSVRINNNKINYTIYTIKKIWNLKYRN